MEGNRIINVVGWYGKNNVGDEAYKAAFRKLWPEANFVFSDEPVKADYYIIGGGDVISPAFVDNVTKNLKAPFSVMSVAMPDHAQEEKLAEAERVWVRDHVSLRNAISKGLNAELVPDFAFALEADARKGEAHLKNKFDSENLELYNSKIAVIINSHVAASHDTVAYKYAQFERFSWEMASVADNFSASFVFIPFGTSSPWDDRTAASSVSSKCKFWKKNCVIYDRMSVQEALNMISACDACISMRLHSSIFATIGSTPFVDVTHNHKNPNYLKTIKREDWKIPYTSFCKKTMHRHLEHRIIETKTESKMLQEVADEQRELLRARASSVSFL